MDLSKHIEEIMKYADHHRAFKAILNLVLKLNVRSEVSFCICLELTQHLNEVLENDLPLHQSQQQKQQLNFEVFLVLRDLLKVPKLEQLKFYGYRGQKRNVIVAEFISFLIPLMKDYYQPRCDPDSGPMVAHKLEFLVSVLGDTPVFQAAEPGHVEDLLDEFEKVANKIGSVLLLAFYDQIHKVAAAACRALIKPIDNLNESILNFLKSLVVTEEAITSDSVFIVDSVLCDLEDIMNSDRVDNLSVRDQIKVIHQWLVLFKSLCRGTKLPQHLYQINELKQPFLQIRSTAHQLEYLINSFLVGDEQLRYLTLRLPHVIDKLKDIVSRVQEISKDFTVGVFRVAEASFTLLPQQLKKISELKFPNPAIDALKNLVLKLEVDYEVGLRIYKQLRKYTNEVLAEQIYPMIFRKEINCKVFLLLRDDLLKVPKLEQLSHENNGLKRKEIIEGFISFLLPLMKTYYKPTCDPDCGPIVAEKLGFLLSVLGDTPVFQAAEHGDGHVEDFLDEFEKVANETGSLLHLAFDDQIDQLAAAACRGLIKHIDHLHENITSFINSLPCAVVSVEPITCSADFFIVDSVLCDLNDLINSDENLPVKDQFKVIHQWLILFKSLCKRMALPQHLEINELEEPMMQITSVAYEVEYLIRCFLVGDAQLFYLTIRLPHVISKLTFTVTRLQEMLKDFPVGVLRVAEDFGGVQLSPQAKNESLSNDVIVRFEKEREILDQITEEKTNLQFIFISGMPGLGKTTLARKVYNHHRVREFFDRRSWCIISQNHQQKTLWVEILIDLEGDTNKATISDMKEEEATISDMKEEEATISDMKEEDLAQKVYQTLKGRRYIIVMDDIWNSKVWDEMRRFFPDDVNGSRIIFTSRNKGVAPSGSIIHELPFLSSDQCWELLRKKVFYNRACPPQLQNIGQRIAVNCAGLPLAVVAIAGVLSTMGDEESVWENVADNVQSFLSSDKGISVMHILELSYKYLPPHLKPCFLYFAMFEEDEQIMVRKLTQYWIAEGFICKEENTRTEVVAEKYLMELVDRGLVIVGKRTSLGGVKICMIHDLMHELCLIISEKNHFLKVVDKSDCSIWNHKHHRLSVRTGNFTPNGSCIRSLIAPPQCSITVDNLGTNLLRLLDCYQPRPVDDQVVKAGMINLRYLSTNDQEVLKFADRMLNLEFLILQGHRHQVDTYSNIMKMVKLKYLKVDMATFDKSYDFHEESNLEYLSCIHLDYEEDVRKLKYFPHLHRLKCKIDVYALDLLFLNMLESLSVEIKDWKRQVHEVQFPCSIRKLTLSWFIMTSDSMSTIGALPNLEVLKLICCDFEGKIWETRDDEFQQLRVLKLESLSSLSQWNVCCSEHFPRLRQLILVDNPNLVEIPGEIGEIDTLQLIEVHGKCKDSLLASVECIKKQQEYMGYEGLVVDIGGAKSRGILHDWE